MLVYLVHVKYTNAAFIYLFVLFTVVWVCVWKGWARNVIKMHTSIVHIKRFSFLIKNANKQHFRSIYHRIESHCVHWHFSLKSTWENPTLRMCIFLFFFLGARKIFMQSLNEPEDFIFFSINFPKNPRYEWKVLVLVKKNEFSCTFVCLFTFYSFIRPSGPKFRLNFISSEIGRS